MTFALVLVDEPRIERVHFAALDLTGWRTSGDPIPQELLSYEWQQV